MKCSWASAGRMIAYRPPVCSVLPHSPSCGCSTLQFLTLSQEAWQLGRALSELKRSCSLGSGGSGCSNTLWRHDDNNDAMDLMLVNTLRQ